MDFDFRMAPLRNRFDKSIQVVIALPDPVFFVRLKCCWSPCEQPDKTLSVHERTSLSACVR